MISKIRIKSLLSNMFTVSGLLTLFERYYYADKAFILMYHRVLDSTSVQPFLVQPGMYVSTATFEKHVTHLKAKFNVVFVDELVDKIVSGKDVSRTCAITFDDGWYDNYSEAFNILKKYNLPATIFLTSGFVGTDKLFWPEEISYYLGHIIKDDINFESAFKSVNHFLNEIEIHRKDINLECLIDKAIRILKACSPVEREEIVNHFRDKISSTSIPRQILNWNEAREMLNSGLIHFGAHSVNHEILDLIPLETAESEIIDSRGDIELHLGTDVRMFAYPNGNHNPQIRALVAKNSFSGAVTTSRGVVKHGTPCMELPRIAMHEDVCSTIPMFRTRIAFNTFR